MTKIFDLAVNTLTEWVWAKDLNNITEGFEIGSKYHYRAVVFAQEIHRLTRELNTLKYQAKKDKAEIEWLRAAFAKWKAAKEPLSSRDLENGFIDAEFIRKFEKAPGEKGGEG